MGEFRVSRLTRTRTLNQTCAICQNARSAYLVVGIYVAGRIFIKRTINEEDVTLWIKFSWFWKVSMLTNLTNCTKMILFHENT
jgi:hypothetical protein